MYSIGLQQGAVGIDTPAFLEGQVAGRKQQRLPLPVPHPSGGGQGTVRSRLQQGGDYARLQPRGFQHMAAPHTTRTRPAKRGLVTVACSERQWEHRAQP